MRIERPAAGSTPCGKVFTIDHGPGRGGGGRRSVSLGLGPDRRHLDRAVGDFDLAEECGAGSICRRGATSGEPPACPSSPARGLSRPPGTRPSTASAAGPVRGKARIVRCVAVRPDRRGAGLRHERDSRRSPAADLHLLPPGAGPEAQVGADAAHAGRPGDRRDRARVSGAGDDDGAAAGARQAQDSRRGHSLRGARHHDMAARLDAVLTVIYLVFNEGYAATRGGPLVRTDLCAEAIRLGRLVDVDGPPPPAEATALVALMLLHDSRRDARVDEAGDLSCSKSRIAAWDHSRLPRRCRWSRRRLRGGAGPFALQAAIAALHCQAARADRTDWPQIVRLYDLLERCSLLRSCH